MTNTHNDGLKDIQIESKSMSEITYVTDLLEGIPDRNGCTSAKSNGNRYGLTRNLHLRLT